MEGKYLRGSPHLDSTSRSISFSRHYFVGSDSSLNDFQAERLSLDTICFVLLSRTLFLSPPSLSLSLSLSSYFFVPLISKQTPFRLEDDPTDPFRICGEQRHHRRHRPPICSAEKSASRTGLINVNLALSEIAQSTSVRFMMKMLRIIAFTYNMYHDNVITFAL